MVGAIGSSRHFSPAGSGPSIAGLEAQLARLEKVLSECVSCSSAKTHEGQEAIKEVSCQIGDIRARIEKATIEKSGAAEPVATAVAAPSPAPGWTALGSRLDVFA